jgi:hypothetical protein
MLRRLIAIATIVTAPCACAGLLDLDPGTLRATGAEAGADSDVTPPPEEDGPAADAAPRGCKSALGSGVYCDDFDESGRTDPSAREAKAVDEAKDSLSLSDEFSFSPPRSLQAKYLNTGGTPRAYLSMPWHVAGGTFRMTMAVRVARAGISVGDPLVIGELQEVPGRDGIQYAIQLTPRQEGIEVRLREANVTLIYHLDSFPYDEWHVIAMRFQGKYAYLELDGKAVSEGTAELTGDYDVHFGIYAFAPATVFLDNVEIGP